MKVIGDSGFSGGESETPVSMSTGSVLRWTRRTLPALALVLGAGVFAAPDARAQTAPTFGVTVAPAAIVEGATATFTVTLSAAAPMGGVSGTYTISDAAGGSDIDAADFTAPANALTGTFTIAANAMTGTFAITAAADADADETFRVVVAATAGMTALAVTAGATAQIDVPINAAATGVSSVSASPSTISEPFGQTAITVTLNGPARIGGVTIDYTLAEVTGDNDGFAAADITATDLTSGQVTISEGARTGTVLIALADDRASEGREDFTFTLDEGNYGVVGAAGTVVVPAARDSTRATVMIMDDEATGVASITMDKAYVREDGVNAAARTITVTVALSGPAPTGNVDLDYTIAAAPAPAGMGFVAADITAASLTGTVRINAGDTTGTFTVIAMPDNTAERDETFTITLDASTGTGDARGVVIRAPADDDDPPLPRVTVGIIDDDRATAVMEFSAADADPIAEDGGTKVLTVTLNGDALADVVIPYRITGIQAADLNGALTGMITVAMGAATGMVTLTSMMDSAAEGDEVLTVSLVPGIYSGVLVLADTDTGMDGNQPFSDTITITDATGPQARVARLVFAPPAINESDGAANAFTVTLAGAPTTADVEIGYTLSGTATGAAGATAMAMEDYVIAVASGGTISRTDATSGTITIPGTNILGSGGGVQGDAEGAAVATISIDPVDDSVDEGMNDGANAETIGFVISATGISVTNLPPTGIVGIIDNDATPTATLARLVAAATVDESAGTTNAFTVTLADAPTTADVVVTYALSGTATGAAGAAATGMEDYVISVVAGSGTIDRTNATSGTITIPMANIVGTGGDEEGNAAGAAEATIIIIPVDDSGEEDGETVLLSITAASLAVVNPMAAMGTVTIVDNDTATAVTSIAANPAGITEATATATTIVTVTLNNPAPPAGVMLAYEISGSGVGNDITAGDLSAPDSLSGVVNIVAAASTGMVTITARDDALDEGTSETLTFELTEDDGTGMGYNGVVVDSDNDSDDQITIVITDNDTVMDANRAVVSLTASRATVDEGGAATARRVTFTAEVNKAPAGGNLDLPYRISGVTAGDIMPAGRFTGMLTIPEDQTVGTINIDIAEDQAVEGDEMLTLTLEPGVRDGYRVAQAQTAQVIITDDDVPQVTVDDTEITEGVTGDDGTATITVTLPNGRSARSATSFAYDITGVDESDIMPSSTTGMITVPQGMSSGTLDITAVEDEADEGDETLTFSLRALANMVAAGSRTSVNVVIHNDEVANEIVSLESSQNQIYERGESVRFTVTLNGPAAVNTNIAYTIAAAAGAAGEGFTVDDITAESRTGMTTVRAGSRTATVDVTAQADSTTEGDERFVLSLDPPTTGPPPTGFPLGTGVSPVPVVITEIPVEADYGTRETARRQNELERLNLELANAHAQILTGMVRERVQSRPGVRASSRTDARAPTLSLTGQPTTLKDLAANLQSDVPLQTRDGGTYEAWVKGLYRGLSGDPTLAGRAFSYDGNLWGISGGVERLWRNSLAGVSVAYTSATLDTTSAATRGLVLDPAVAATTDATTGEFTETMAVFAPYASFWLGAESRLWVSAGAGTGTAEDMRVFTPAAVAAIDELDATTVAGEADASLLFLAGGYDYTLRKLGRSPLEVELGVSSVILNKTIDAMTYSDDIATAEVSNDLFQLRGEATAFYPSELRSGMILRPFLGLAVAHELGDSVDDDEQSVSIHGGVGVAQGRWQARMEGDVELLRDSDSWGISGDVRFRPRLGGGGWSLGLAGAHDMELQRNPADTDVSESWDLNLEAGYGIAVGAASIWEGGMLTPYIATGHTGDGPAYGSGLRMESMDGGMQLELGLTHEPEANDGDGEAEAIIRGSIRL